MGRGDKRTRKGKQFRKSHGKTRPNKTKKTVQKKAAK
jgi:ribosomal small subunit protein bTHX